MQRLRRLREKEAQEEREAQSQMKQMKGGYLPKEIKNLKFATNMPTIKNKCGSYVGLQFNGVDIDSDTLSMLRHFFVMFLPSNTSLMDEENLDR